MDETYVTSTWSKTMVCACVFKGVGSNRVKTRGVEKRGLGYNGTVGANRTC